MENKKTSDLNTLKNLDLLIFFVFALFFVFLAVIGGFTKLDYRLYDFLLRFTTPPKQSEKIVHVNIDDESIADLGEWPWSRDIIADSLLHLKELGADSVVFDVEYLSPSSLGVPSDSELKISQAFDTYKTETGDLIFELSDAVKEGSVKPSEIRGFAEELVNNYVNVNIDNLQDTVIKTGMRDNDDYFARALQFFGKSYLTVNTRDVKIKVSPDDIDYVKKRFLKANVLDPKNYITLNNIFTSNEQYSGEKSGFSPALHNFLAHSKGIGFTNIIIDSDGSRRRVELLHNYNGLFVKQLVFSPLMDFLDCNNFERARNSLILKKALYPGENKREDVAIPLDEHGRMLINWLHTSFGKSFRHESIYFLKQLEILEKDIEQNLNNFIALILLDENGTPLSYYSLAEDLLNSYSAVLNEKNALLALCNGFDEDGKVLDGISDVQYENYFKMRKEYFGKIKEFSLMEFLSEISERLGQLKEMEGGITEETGAEFISLFKNEQEQIKNNVEIYENYMTEMGKSFKDSFCIIGNTASSTTDNGSTPFVRLYPNVGTHANVVNTILQKDFITPIAWYYGYFIAVLAIFIIMFAFHRFGTVLQNILNGIIALALILIPIFMMIMRKIYIPCVPIVFLSVFSYFGGIAARYINSSREKSFIRTTFSQFVSKDVVDEIIKDPEKANLGGRNEHITALFSDIKSFSSFSEKVSPEQLVKILNEYLGALSDRILENNGTIDKYIGDSIVSLFGAPVHLDQHAYAACCAAIKMKKTEKEFNRKHIIDGDIPCELYTRIGINTGDMVVGNMGTTLKKNYTMMGDNVNLASRLEGVNKVYGTWILCSEETWLEANFGKHKGELVARKLDKVRVVGKSVPVQLYNIIDFRSNLTSRQFEEIEVFEHGLSLYLQRRFREAYKYFMQANTLVPTDQAALVFAERCKTYAQKALPENWDGIMNLTSK